MTPTPTFVTCPWRYGDIPHPCDAQDGKAETNLRTCAHCGCVYAMPLPEPDGRWTWEGLLPQVVEPGRAEDRLRFAGSV